MYISNFRNSLSQGMEIMVDGRCGRDWGYLSDIIKKTLVVGAVVLNSATYNPASDPVPTSLTFPAPHTVIYSNLEESVS